MAHGKVISVTVLSSTRTTWDLDDAPEQDAEARILDQATAARSIAELKAEIETLKRLETLALEVCRAGRDT